ncbi:MAG: GNAT family N-acetyltransferase [Thaumarchaeota archaeon]|nr:GNAT family N-acetyltransferase [Nitrososphaerota archaeon]
MATSDSEAEITKVKTIDEQLGELPRGLSPFYDPLLRHEVNESLESGGEVFLSQDPSGVTDGLFIYDGFEATGTIFTRSRDVFERFYRIKPSSYIFSELEVAEYPHEAWNIWQLDVDNASSEYRFRYNVSICHEAAEIERFMAVAEPETNKRWVSVALANGDKCFVVKIAGRIVGIAWMTIVGDVARSHGLFVAPRFRKLGMSRDNFQARLIYLKSRGVHTLINEISESNVASHRLASSEGEKVVGKIYLYESPKGKEPS